MKIRNIRINGIDKPIGFLMDEIILSFIVEDVKNPSFLKAQIIVNDENNIIYNLNDVTAFDHIKLDFELKVRTRYNIIIKLKDNEEEIEDYTYFITGKRDEKRYGRWIGVKEKILPKFVKEFECKKNLKKAIIHISSLGIFELFINKKRIGDEYLTPYLSEYRKEVQLITFDVTTYLQDNNLLEVGVGPGWYSGHFGGPDGKEIFGDKIALYLELHLEYENGIKDLIYSDAGFKVYNQEICFSDIYDGETIDETLLIKPYHLCIYDDINIDLIDRVSLPVKIKEIIPVKEIIKTKKEEIVLDFGQNHTGILHCKLPANKEVVMECGEVLQDGCFYNENYRTAKARFSVKTLNGGLYYSHYTFYGYRYIRITGLDNFNINDFESFVLYSDIERTGYFITQDELINRLYLNSLWGLKSNFVDMPTDCPQRDERLGWSGDAQVFCHTANYHMNARVFYEKYLRDLRIYQKELKGGVPSCIPEIFGEQIFTAVWGDAACIIPKELFLVYGDVDILKRHYDLMKDWVDYLDNLIRTNNKKNYLWNFGFQYGDWLALDGESETSCFGGTDSGYIASIYYYNSLDIVEMSSKLLGKIKEEKHYHELKKEIRDNILHYYFKNDGTLLIDTQTAHVISLYFGIYYDKEIIKNRLRSLFRENNDYLKTGFVGTPILLSTLMENNMKDLAVKLFFNEDFPSWLYQVKLGATTIWERWNSLLPDGKVSDTGMNSFNHYSYGSVASFMYEYILGLKRRKPGYEEILIEPLYIRRLKEVEGSYDTKYGKIYVSYKFIFDDITITKCSLPYNIKGELRINDEIYKLENEKEFVIICKLKKHNIY